MATIDNIVYSDRMAKKHKKEYTVNGVMLLINGSLQDGLDISFVKNKIEGTLPRKLFKGLDYIYVGEFPELQAREVESVYMNGAIYITNKIASNKELYKSIIHELAHSLETRRAASIYKDKVIEAEFISKRKKLRSILKAHDLFLKDQSLFTQTSYNSDFDNFLYKKVGYDKLNLLCTGVFVSPYAATSLREYFANGFEHYYLGDIKYLEKTSPKLFNKIVSLTS